MQNDPQFVNMNTSVTAEDLFVHYGSDGQAVEAVGERLPQLDVESAFTCKINKTVSQSIYAYKIQHTAEGLTSDSQHFWLVNPYKKKKKKLCPAAPCHVSDDSHELLVNRHFPLNFSDGFILNLFETRGQILD